MSKRRHGRPGSPGTISNIPLRHIESFPFRIDGPFLLFGVRSTDAATVGVSALILIAAALAGSYLPARAALRLEPLAARRAE